MRRVECWACGEPIEGADPVALRSAFAAHLRAAHGDADPDLGAVDAWIGRHSAPEGLPLGVLTLGRVLSGAAAVTFTFLAFLNPTDIGGTERTLQFLSYLGFAAVSAALLCAITLLGRLLQR